MGEGYLILLKLIWRGINWLLDLPLIRRQARQEAGLCQKCGYDLRSCGNRCPECGELITPTSRMFIDFVNARRAGEVMPQWSEKLIRRSHSAGRPR